MRIAEHRGDLGAGRARADLGHGHRAVRAAEPLHVGEPGREPERLQRLRRDLPDARVLGAADVARQQHHPLHPRVAQHLERGRQVVRDRVPDDLPVHHHAVVGALVAGEELLHLRGPVRRGRHGIEPGAQVGGVVEPEGALRPGPGRRLDDEGEADPFGKFEGVSGGDGQLVPGARDAGRPQHRLHLRLVPEVVRRDRVHAADAQVLPHLGQRDLQLLQHGQQPLHRAELAGQALHRGGDLARVERVVDPPVPGQVLPELGRQPVLRLAGDQGHPCAGQPRRGLHEPRRGVEQIRRDEPGDHHGRERTLRLPCQT